MWFISIYKIGTGAEINGKQYTGILNGDCGALKIEAISDIYVYVSESCIYMEEVPADPNKIPEQIFLSGWFLAKTN